MVDNRVVEEKETEDAVRKDRLVRKAEMFKKWNVVGNIWVEGYMFSVRIFQ